MVHETVDFPCDLSVKSNFTSDLIFLILDDSEKIGFQFFILQNLKWLPNKMADNLENFPKTIPPSFIISRWASTIFTKYQNMVTTVFYFLQVSLQKTVGKVSPILVTLTSRSDSNFERSNNSLKENKRDGVDSNSNGFDYCVRQNDGKIL